MMESVDTDDHQLLCGFDELPDQLVTQIFSFLCLEDLCRNVSPVSRRWHRLANDPYSWSRCTSLQIDRKTMPISEQQLKFLLALATNLRQLDIPNGSLSEAQLWSPHCAKVRELDISDCWGAMPNTFETLVRNCQQIEKLHLEDCRGLTHASIVHISNFPKLTSINLMNNRDLQDDSIVYLSYNLKTLKSINLFGCGQITDYAIEKMVNAQRENLKHVYLNGQLLLDESIIALATCHKLKSLCVDTSSQDTGGFTDDCLPHIKKMSSLRRLQINQWGCRCCQGPSFSTEGLRDLFVDSKLGSLMELDLATCNRLDGRGLRRIRDCCPNLRELTLTSCYQIEEAHVDGILNDLPFLTVLDLNKTKASNHPVVKEIEERHSPQE